MRLHLPNSAFLGNIDPFLSGIDFSEPDRLTITANKKWISVHPVVLSMVAALGLKISSKKVICETLEAKSRHYLERMGLFRFLGLDSGMKIVEHEPAGRFVPLTQIRSSAELTAFVTEVVPLLHLDPVQAEPIRYIISELVRNVLEHAESEIGAILCAQFYPKSNTIRMGIVDIGVGIKKTINVSYDAKTDLDAIHLALVPGITGTTRLPGGTDYNAGAGLFFIKSIAKVNREHFMIYSGGAMYKLLKTELNKSIRLFADPQRDKHSSNSYLPYWQGTIVGVDINLSQGREFSALLDHIRKIWAESVEERKRIRRKEARFI